MSCWSSEGGCHVNGCFERGITMSHALEERIARLFAGEWRLSLAMNGHCSRRASMAATVVLLEPDISMTTTMTEEEFASEGRHLFSSSSSALHRVPGIAAYRCDHRHRDAKVVRYALSSTPRRPRLGRLPLLVALSRCRRHAGAVEPVRQPRQAYFIRENGAAE